MAGDIDISVAADAPANLWDAFECVVRRQPSAAALALPDGEVTFEALWREALHCSAWLAVRGVKAGHVVALQLPKARVTYALWLACIRQGAVYTFVDPANPAARTQQILQRLKPVLLVTIEDAENPFGATVRVQPGELDSGFVPQSSDVPPAGDVHGLSPAYVMFTSGSTGEPKGAVIPHQGVLGLMRWARTLFAHPENERFSNLNPLHFDNSVFDLYCGLMNGATLVPVETAMQHNPLAWAKALRHGRASVAFAVPTLFLTLERLRLLTPASLPDIRTFLFGGEGFPIAALTRFHAAFAGRARLVNVYGPTETSCICSSLEIDDQAIALAGTGLASLGRFHEGFTFAILSDELTPVDRGQPGELWIGGAHVGLGYFGDPDETARRFRQDPGQSAYRSVWYRSGDLVREDHDGRLWFHGRADNQVKIRGHRIELEEIDLALEGFPAIARAVAVVVPAADGPEICAAFCASEPLALEAVRAHCAGRLPSYMQPARLTQLETLPQNANGKVDRRAVRELLERLR